MKIEILDKKYRNRMGNAIVGIKHINAV